ncbi:Subunit of the glycosylphosphatidylinositol transamidase complex-like protein [Saccharomyces pastorianus]|uniref:Subunit of the glycosylphosphatidylinositol transamidase complex-like protein n=1 Tax=Saccharomyces pastorianus TaxID=27292 RepID=A0A6C1EFI6_SACPS|nr:Subunit of the glycosylphosphatidylinositol transamidase complex-like protein [Saccharomyces pastorianus]
MIGSLAYCILGTLLVGAVAQDTTVPQIGVDDSLWYPYDETLLLKPLPNNDLLLSFTFQLQSEPFDPAVSSHSFDAYEYYTTFPRAIPPLLDSTATRQFHLRFTRGFWDALSWGQLPHGGKQAGASGVELWSLVQAADQEQAFQNWKKLANSLSGLFCSSLNFVDESRTTFPRRSYASGSASPLFNDTENLYLMRASLPNEPICTENLTPFIKLLPTRGHSGLTSLLDGHKLFDSLWNSISLDITTVCTENGDSLCHYEMEAHVDMATHVPSVLARNERPIPKPLDGNSLRCDMDKPFDSYQCFPLPDPSETHLKLSQLFSKSIKNGNLFANRPTKICADVDRSTWTAHLSVDDTIYSTHDNCFELSNDQNESGSGYDFILESSDTTQVSPVDPVPIHVGRSLTGNGQDRGGIRTAFHNDNDTPVKLIYFESLPWFVRVYLSSLQITSTTSSHLHEDDIITDKYYLQAADRQRPAHLEFTMLIPAHSNIVMTYQFDKALLQFAEYPPDANHGFEIDAAVITVLSPESEEPVYETRTSTLLLSLSTPDFSMPYNVIILTSTIMGLIFGMLYNLMVKRIVTVDEADKIMLNSGLKYKLLKLKEKLLKTKQTKID